MLAGTNNITNQTNQTLATVTGMRLIGELDDPQQAEKFSSFLITEGIAVKTEEADNGGAEIWVKDEDQFQQAMQELESFRRDPGNSKYSDSVQKANQISRAEAKKRREIQKKIVNVGAGELKRKPKVTLTMIGICVVVALITDFGDSWRTNGRVMKALEFVAVDPPKSLEVLRQYNGDVDSLGLRLTNIKRGEIWRIITPIFIHHGTIHLLFNMIWLFQLGKMIELRFGSYRFLIIVLVTAAISNLVQCTVPSAVGGSAPGTTPDGTLMTLLGGMSGVVYGLLGFVWMKSIYDRSSGFYLPQSTLVIMLGWMLFCMLPGSEKLIGSIANWAHAVGLIVGMALGYAPVWIQKNFY